MATFLEACFVDPTSKALVKRTLNTDVIASLDPASNGRALVNTTGRLALPAGQAGLQLATYEAYGAVVARLASATQANPTASVSSEDLQAAEANQQADQSAASGLASGSASGSGSGSGSGSLSASPASGS